MISFQMGGVLELYPLGLKELAAVDCLVDRTDMIAPSSPHLIHTQASKTSLLRTFSVDSQMAYLIVKLGQHFVSHTGRNN